MISAHLMLSLSLSLTEKHTHKYRQKQSVWNVRERQSEQAEFRSRKKKRCKSACAEKRLHDENLRFHLSGEVSQARRRQSGGGCRADHIQAAAAEAPPSAAAEGEGAENERRADHRFAES